MPLTQGRLYCESANMNATVLLNVTNLSVDFRINNKQVHAVKNVSFQLEKGKTLALVGESGSGKSVSALSILQLLPYPTASHPSGSILVNGQEVMNLNTDQLRKIRGNQVSMIFQEPMTSLNPLHRVEKQIREVLFLHKGLTGTEATARVLELLTLVGIRDPQQKLFAYPHELSGGQRQRVMIAMALANEPELLIADEPTTALDVTIQAQILQLLAELQKKLGMAILLITHDLGIVRHYSDQVCIMSQGEIVESGDTAKVFASPQHAYSMMLLRAEPKGEPAAVPWRGRAHGQHGRRRKDRHAAAPRPLRRRAHAACRAWLRRRARCRARHDRRSTGRSQARAGCPSRRRRCSQRSARAPWQSPGIRAARRRSSRGSPPAIPASMRLARAASIPWPRLPRQGRQRVRLPESPQALLRTRSWRQPTATRLPASPARPPSARARASPGHRASDRCDGRPRSQPRRTAHAGPTCRA